MPEKRMVLAGVDGCKVGWLCVVEEGAGLSSFVVENFSDILDRLPNKSIIAIDIPIGLTDQGPRECDRAARRFLGAPRSSSVFPAPVRAALVPGSHEEISETHFQADGRRISSQLYSILPKIREVDEVMRNNPSLQQRVREVHPEVSFAFWNDGDAMQDNKASSKGRADREALIDATLGEVREELWRGLKLYCCERDDLNDAFAALWTARRIHHGEERSFPSKPEEDRYGLRMEIVG